MLRLYYGRENRNKDRFLFDQVGRRLHQIQGSERKLLLVVPDQFTLQAEQNAFAYLDVAGLMDLEVLSQSRLGYRVLAETGGSARLHIDKYGRHMVLAGIVQRLEPALKTYGGMKKSGSFVELANDFIIEMKQNNADPQQVLEILSQVEGDSLLYNKLSDIQKIYEAYEEALSGKYMDTEDYLSLVISKLPQSTLIQGNEIWLYGFDSFTEKSMQMIEVLMKCAGDVNVIMTGEDAPGRDGELFELTDRVMYRLSCMAREAGVSWEKQGIPLEYAACLEEKAPVLSYLEQELYAYPHIPYAGGEKGETEAGLQFCRAANLYAEVETGAVHILELIRDKGFACKDIAVICNDLEKYGSIIKRVFGLYHIPVFLDEKRTVLHDPGVEVVVSLLEVMTKGWQQQDVFRLLKTGLYPMDYEDYGELENYCIKYRIRGRRWKTPFRYGLSEYGQQGLERLEALRSALVLPLSRLESDFNAAKTAREKSRVLYDMLTQSVNLPGHLEALLHRLNEEKELEAAEEISQIWAVIVGLLDQMVELVGDEALSAEDYSQMLQAGFQAVEIGLLPPSLDQVIVGTMQRTRRGRVRALLVLGANDGLIPADSGKEDLLSAAEKNILAEKNIVLCKDDDYRTCEERLAIYKNLSKPEEYLWVGYSVADLDGREKKPSLIFDKLTKIFPMVPIDQDVLNLESDLVRVQGVTAALPHMSEAFRNKLSGETAEISRVFKVTYNQMKEMSSKEFFAGQNELAMLQGGLFFTNRIGQLEERLVDRLYKKEGMEDFILSPSRLERFGKCPFSHFVQYGLRPQEQRVFEVAGREVGDVYHQCLMELSQELTTPQMDVTDPASPWMQCTREECQTRVEQIIDRISVEYREGILKQGGEEQYRSQRMKKIAAEAAWAMVSHVRQGRIKEVFFEAEFGQGTEKSFPPILVETGNQRVRIEGKIDRVDVLPQNYVKIVDYKSGSERFDMEEAREGIRLQLMLYLEAAMGGVKASQPAGVFYFEIAEPMVDASGFSAQEIGEKVADQIRKSFKMDGLMVDEPTVLEGIAGEFAGFSSIVPLRRGAKGVAGTSEGKLLDAQGFESFRQEVGQTVKQLCTQLVCGDTAIHPKKTKYQNACNYCQLKGICCFDLSFEDCQYR